METNYEDAKWLTKLDFKQITQWVENGSSKKLQKADHWTLVIAQKLFKATAFTSDVGKVAVNFNLNTYDGGALTFSAQGRKFLCVGDVIDLQDPLTGEYDRQQSWVHIGEFADVPSGTFS